MADATSKLDIVVQLQDQASEAMARVGTSLTQNLSDIRDKANQVALTFGATGAAILAPLGLIVDGAAKDQAALESLTTTVQAAIDAADSEAGATDAVAKQKALLQGQLTTVNAKLEDYIAKSRTSKGATGEYTGEIEKLQQQSQALKDKLGGVTAQQDLLGASTSDIVDKFKEAANANTDLGFIVEDSVKSFNKLFAATGSVTESLALNHLVMDLARKANIDLTTATTQVILATEGNGRALKQYGINLKDGLTPMQAVSELQQKLKNQAVDFTMTLEGQMAVTKAKTQELSDAIGSDLIPALTNALTSLTPIIEKLTQWIEAHPKLTTAILIGIAALGALFVGIGAVAGAISGAITIVMALSTAFTLFGAVLAFVAANPIVWIIAALVALGVGIYELVTHWQAVRDFTLKIWNDIASFIEDHWRAIVAILMPGFGNLVVFITEHLSQIETAWSTTWTAISNFTMGIWDGIKTGVENAIGFVQGLIQSFTSWAQGIISPIVNSINSVGSAANAFGHGLSTAFGAAASVIGVHDAVITPSGQIIQTDPADYLFATKTPGNLGNSGRATNITVNIQGGNYLDRQGAAMIGNELAKQIGRQLKLSNYAS